MAFDLGLRDNGAGGFDLQLAADNNVVIAVPAGSLTITGSAPAAQQPVPNGAVVITGQAPVVVVNRIAQPATGALTITGPPPSLVQNVTVGIAAPGGLPAFTAAWPHVEGEEVATLTSGNATATGSDRAVLGAAIASGFSGVAPPDGMRFGGSGGTEMVQVGTDRTGIFTADWAAFQLTGVSAVAQAIYAYWAAAPQFPFAAAVAYENVNQLSPVGTPVSAISNAGGTSHTETATVTTSPGDKVWAWAVHSTGDSSSGPPVATSNGTDRVNNLHSIELYGVVGWERDATGSSTDMTLTVVNPVSTTIYIDIYAFVLSPSGTGAGALRIEGQAPTIAIGQSVATGAGSATITGQAPTVSVSGAGGTTITVPAGALAITGQSPSLLNNVVAQLPSPGYATDTLFDNFDDNVKDTSKWQSTATMIGPINAVPRAGSVTETNGRVEITTPASADGAEGYSTTALNMTGRSIRVRVVPPSTNPATTPGHFYLIAATDNSYWMAFNIHLSRFGTQSISAQVLNSGSGGTEWSETYDSAVHAWLRIDFAADGNSASYYTAPDNAGVPGEWVLRRTITVTLYEGATSLQVGFFAESDNNLQAAHTWQADNFSWVPASAVIQGQAPNALVNFIEQPTQGEINFTGHAPTALVNFIAQPGAGAITVTGREPYVQQPAHSAADDFSSGTVDTNFWEPNGTAPDGFGYGSFAFEAPNGSFTRSGGVLTLTPTLGSYNSCWYVSRNRALTMNNSFIRVKVVTPPEQNESEVLFGVSGNSDSANGAGSMLRWQIYNQNDPDPTVIRALFWSAGSQGATWEATFDPVNHAWLQIRRTLDGDVFWETAPDDNGWPGTWTVRRQLSVSDAGFYPASTYDRSVIFAGVRRGFGSVLSASAQIDGLNVQGFDVDTGALTIAGQAPTVLVNHLVQPGAGSITLTGHAPTVTVASGSTDTAIAVPAGAITITGQAPTLVIGSVVAPSAGSLVVSGQTPVVLRGTVVQPGAGSATLSGHAPSLLVNRIVQPGSVEISFTGQAPIALRGDVVQPGAGSLTISGQAPSITSDVVVNPGVGSVSVQGYAPVVGVGIVVPAGSLTATGQTPTALVNAIVQPGTATLAITGQVPVALRGSVVTPGAGSLTIQGQAPSVERGVGVGAGSITITGYAPTVLVNHIVQPGVGTAVISGQAPSVASDLTIGAGQIVVQGYAPNAVVNVFAQPGAGSATFSGHAPVVVRGQVIDVPAGSLTVTGQAPTDVLGVVAQPAAGSLVISGQAPVALVNHLVQPGSGSLVITGQAPSITGTSTYQPEVGTVTAQGYAPIVAIGVGVPAGSLSATGQNPATVVGFIEQPGQGAISVQGYAPTLVIAQIEQPDSGSVTITGHAPTALVSTPGNTNYAPDAGSITVTGYGPALALTMPVPAGSVAVTGYAPSAVVGRFASPGAGSLAITGQAPTILRGAVVQPGPGSLVIVGQAPTNLVALLEQPGNGSAQITGHAPSVQVGASSAPGTGNVTAQGYAPSVVVGTISQPGNGSATVSGYEPAVVQNYIAQPAAGSLQISGQAPNANIGSVGDPQTGLLTATGHAPVALVNHLVSPGAGTVTIQGYSPATLGTSVAVPVPAGELTITGEAPTALVAPRFIPGNGELVITGYAPSIFIALPGVDDADIPPDDDTVMIYGEDDTVDIPPEDDTDYIFYDPRENDL